eukprot:CAMPEP_0178995484 /NCGR_PEP_ID=MMETSP0795-20121207/7851_1 /TAXON_ID=88552 /ORGANISM="Amoebophrya sp., Strain Ameob2" /LENGTH=458 /DNA_ID=CAMNT_0020687793 /DNA_START=414 /DNA_END=1791 /DNA_ORIENTATION=+
MFKTLASAVSSSSPPGSGQTGNTSGMSDGNAHSPSAGEIDSFVTSLLEIRHNRKNNPARQQVAQIPLNENDIKKLLNATRTVLLSQPVFLELEAPLNILGDIHGQYFDLLRFFDTGGWPPEYNYLCLGDYVDRGRQSLEVMCLLMCYKLKYPENFFLLRGNHECAGITRIYGFYDDCKRRYSVKLWKFFCDMFNCLPMSALIDEKILCVHGGLSPSLTALTDLKSFVRPTDVPDTGMLCDLLWADPDQQIKGWAENDRGVSYIFGTDVVQSFLRKHDLDLICRAHQVVEDGYEFFAKRQLITLFSAPNYCEEFDNAGAMMKVDETLMCSFKVLKPVPKSMMKEKAKKEFANRRHEDEKDVAWEKMEWYFSKNRWGRVQLHVKPIHLAQLLCSRSLTLTLTQERVFTDLSGCAIIFRKGPAASANKPEFIAIPLSSGLSGFLCLGLHFILPRRSSQTHV